MKNILVSRLFYKLTGALFLAFIIPHIVIITIIMISGYYSYTSQLDILTKKIESVLINPNGTINNDRYNASTETPHPHGSSGFPDPLYIFTLSGFVIERNQPIPGYLDYTDYEKIQGYTTPQTITTETKEQWRVLSRTFSNTEDSEVTAIVGYLDPGNADIQTIDEKLQNSLDRIAEKITRNGHVNTSNLQATDLPYDVAFEIVNNRNILLVNNGHIPTYIDPSYVQRTIEAGNRIGIEQGSGTDLYIVKTHILQANSKTIGVIAAGKSIQQLATVVQWATITYILLAFASAFAMGAFVTAYLMANRQSPLWKLIGHKDDNQVVEVTFFKEKGVLQVDRTSIPIPPDTFQHFLLDLLFSLPGKQWSIEEIENKIPENHPYTKRTLYDTVIQINKKATVKLVEYEHKEIYLNRAFGIIRK